MAVPRVRTSSVPEPSITASPWTPASLATRTGLPVSFSRALPRSNPAQEGSRFGAVSVRPWTTTPGKPAATRSKWGICATISLTTASTALGVAGCGVSMRTRSLISRSDASAVNPLMPVPPMSRQKVINPVFFIPAPSRSGTSPGLCHQESGHECPGGPAGSAQLFFQLAVHPQHRRVAALGEPVPGRRVPLEVGVPEGGRPLEDEAVEDGVLRPLGLEEAAGEDHVVSPLEGHQVLVDALDVVVGDAPLGRLGVADRAVVLGAGHVEDGDVDVVAIDAVVVPLFGDRRAHGDGRLEARLGEVGLLAKALARHGHRRPGAEGVAGHAGAREVEPVGEGRAALIELLQLVEDEAHVQGSRHGVAGIAGGLLQVLEQPAPLGDRGGIAPQVLDVDGDVPPARPVAAEILIAVPRAT